MSEHDEVVYAGFGEMREFMRLAFIAAGVPAEDAAICADVLIESDKRGIDSHGVGRLKPIYLDRIKEGIQFPSANPKWSGKALLPRLLTAMTAWVMLSALRQWVWP
jgi:LDH2 family malate/lactate/ureidoglycolate dehydrogenase